MIGKKLHYRGIQSLFLAKLKELWLCANERFRMHNGLARNCGYVRRENLGCAVDLQGIVVINAGMGDLECAVDYHVLSSHTDFQLQFE